VLKRVVDDLNIQPYFLEPHPLDRVWTYICQSEMHLILCMFQTLPKTTTFAAFLEWKPDGILYELHDPVIVEMQPIGEDEEINGFLGGEVTVEFKPLNLPYFISCPVDYPDSCRGP
jgi:hypothetical protein